MVRTTNGSAAGSPPLRVEHRGSGIGRGHGRGECPSGPLRILQKEGRYCGLITHVAMSAIETFFDISGDTGGGSTMISFAIFSSRPLSYRSIADSRLSIGTVLHIAARFWVLFTTSKFLVSTMGGETHRCSGSTMRTENNRRFNNHKPQRKC